MPIYYGLANMAYAKSSVRYTDDHGLSNEQCSKCTWFTPPDGCRVVIGTIDPDGWCEKYVAETIKTK